MEKELIGSALEKPILQAALDSKEAKNENDYWD